MSARGPFACRVVVPLADAASLFISLPPEDIWVASSLRLLPNLGSFQQLFLELFFCTPPFLLSSYPSSQLQTHPFFRVPGQCPYHAPACARILHTLSPHLFTSFTPTICPSELNPKSLHLRSLPRLSEPSPTSQITPLDHTPHHHSTSGLQLCVT